jgi:hypothetical protein
MATSMRSVFSRLSPARIQAFAYANPGILALVLSVVGAGVLAFYIVAVPPGTVAYP